LSRPLGSVDVFLDLLSVSTAVHEDLLDARIGKKLKGVFNERGICEGQQALRDRQSGIRQQSQGQIVQAYSRALECEGVEAGFKGIRKYLHCLACVQYIRAAQPIPQPAADPRALPRPTCPCLDPSFLWEA
jgi:hypothetical protein